jgi:hypothetical protein
MSERGGGRNGEEEGRGGGGNGERDIQALPTCFSPLWLYLFLIRYAIN